MPKTAQEERMAPTEELNAPINTQAEASLMSTMALGIAMSSGPAEAIDTVMKLGQQTFRDSDTLPQKINRGSKEMLEKAGVQFGEDVKGDKLFQYAKLPPNWKRKSDGGEFWTLIIDEQGRTRASVFYNSAFWDRDAFLNVHQRHTKRRMHGPNVEGFACVRVYDGEEVIFVTERIPVDPKESWLAFEQADAQAKKWLDEHFPDWENSAAYW